ncbi:isochorismate synthase MenF [Ruegeria sp. Ofav3-42]|uniref:isochorismate synthase n=1 Tax=Ruegeria sp. Ofav3-42 TaxID=2917759 RepID=UPI001EF45470|nr:isochorismate synthase [Ruegeria sp. Ofav3-42]MCG7521797.1 isochorismate synthase [Ruegeria sp. Ofav3-42]
MLSVSERSRSSISGDTPACFTFRGAGRVVTAQAACSAVDQGTVDTLEARLSKAFSALPADIVIGGALPFDKRRTDCLWAAPQTTHSAGSHNTGGDQEKPLLAPRAEPPVPVFADAVAEAIRIMEHEEGSPDALRKIVLARTLTLESKHPFQSEAILSRLMNDPAVTTYQIRLPQHESDPHGRYLIGATPELLVGKQGLRVSSYPLAGSARRHEDPVTDSEAAGSLARSEKDKREHAMVVEYILDILAPYCRQLTRPDGPGLTSTRSMWHLGTRIEGELKQAEVSSAVLAAKLHPTPAVCGVPLNRAAQLIKQLEPVDRNFYAGAAGWCDQSGDGAWYVAIRCAEICGRHARLFAGAGIVPGSDPISESAETGAKFGAMLAALGLPPLAGLSGTGQA